MCIARPLFNTRCQCQKPLDVLTLGSISTAQSQTLSGHASRAIKVDAEIRAEPSRMLQPEASVGQDELLPTADSMCTVSAGKLE